MRDFECAYCGKIVSYDKVQEWLYDPCVSNIICDKCLKEGRDKHEKSKI